MPNLIPSKDEISQATQALIGLLKNTKLGQQNFGPNDSTIASALVHPVEALNRGGEWLRHNASVAGGGDPYDNPNPLLGPSREDQAEAGFNLAGLAQLGGMPGAPSSAGGTLGTFIGPKAASWKKDKAALAEKLLDSGASPEKVWKEHMIGRMPGGQLFSEIPDDQAYLKFGNNLSSKGGSGFLPDVYAHDKLYNEYPIVQDTTATLNFGKGDGGSYNRKLDFITADAKYPLNAGSTMAHEIQHNIQKVEGWPRGGSPKQGIDMESAMDIYRRLTGEAQARATQERLNMDMTERQAKYPLKNDYLGGIPTSQLIDYYGNGKQLSVNLPETEFSQAHKIAQQNAALPVEQGGLGLPENNTAMDRANAMGFDTDVYHGSSMRPDFWGKTKDLVSVTDNGGKYEEGRLFSSSSPFIAGNYAGHRTEQPVIFPLSIRSEDVYSVPGRKDIEFQSSHATSGINAADADKKLTAKFENVVDNPGYNPRLLSSDVFASKGGVRSRFAAFDPKKKDSANILASILAGTSLSSALSNKDK